MTKQTVFFEDGTTDEFTLFKWDNGFNHIDNQIRHSASGAVLEQIEFSYHDQLGLLQTRITRDVEHRLRSRTVYQYNEQNLLWRESLVDNRGRVVSTYEFIYDSKGNVTSRTIRNRAGDKLAETIYTNDNAGRVITSETKDGTGNTISSTRFSYDSQGNVISQQTFDGSRVPTTSVRATWQDGLEVRNDMLAADGSLLVRTTNEFGKARELLKSTVNNIQGGSVQIMQFEYILRSRK